MTKGTGKKYYTTAQAAKYVNLTPGRLVNLRSKGEGPKYFKPGGNGHPQYHIDDLDKWMDLAKWEADK